LFVANSKRHTFNNLTLVLPISPSILA
jgi:hypothetical protein